MITSTKKPERPRSSGIDYTPSGQRISPFMNPMRRFKLANLLKWLFLIGLLLIIAWVPSHFVHAFDAQRAISNSKESLNVAERAAYDATNNNFNRPVQICITVFAAVIATLLPRIFLPRGLFGRWVEAAEAFRDWVGVGLLAGFAYLIYIETMKGQEWGLEKTWGPQGPPAGAEWFRWRGIPAMVCGLLAFGITGFFQRKENIGKVPLPVQWLVQALLLGLAFKPLNDGMDKFSRMAPLPLVSLITGLVFCLTMFVALAYAYSKDSKVAELQKHGVRAGHGPTTMTITVIGGRSSGKTTFLAGAYWQWMLEKDRLGPFIIEPLYSQAVVPASSVGAYHETPRIDSDLGTIAKELYQKRELPGGNVSCQDLPFELRLRHPDPTKQHVVARFSVLDYPGGTLVGNASSEAVTRFLRQLDDTDGLLLVADMSNARRGDPDDDYADVMQAYDKIMDRVLKRNGKNRVVPAALVLTKCDEYLDETTGEFKEAELKQDLAKAKYTRMQAYWESQCKEFGPGMTSWGEFYTSALAHTRPADNDPDRRKAYVLQDPPVQPEPDRCAIPLLWLTREMLRWNVTLATDLTTFIMGSSSRYRQQVRHIEDLEQVIENY